MKGDYIGGGNGFLELIITIRVNLLEEDGGFNLIG